MPNSLIMEAVTSIESDKDFRMGTVEDIVKEKHHTGVNTNLLSRVLDGLTGTTATKPINKRRLFEGHKRGLYFWIDLDEEELKEMEKQRSYPY